MSAYFIATPVLNKFENYCCTENIIFNFMHSAWYPDGWKSVYMVYLDELELTRMILSLPDFQILKNESIRT